MKITWFGTATILLEIDGEKLLFDPFFRMNKKLEQPEMSTFCYVDFIFNTHPHFDHLCDLPQILQNTKAKLYGTPTAYLRLETQGVNVDEKVEILCPHDQMQTKNAVVKLHRTFHVKNNLAIVLKTAMRILFKFQFFKAIKILKTHNKFRMGGDIVAFEVQAEGKTVLIFGSAGMDERAHLPQNVDVLVWPFQGRTNMNKYSLPIIEKIRPKTVILDHFDDAFPPITSHIKTDKFVSLMHKKHPEIKVVVPKYNKKIEI